MKLGIQKLSDIISINSVLPFCELKSKYNLKDTEFFKYVQLKNWITVNFDLERNLNSELQAILSPSGKKRRLTRSMYNLLVSRENSDELLQNIYSKWAEDLGDNIKAKWKKCLSFTYKTTTNENLWLIQFKLMTRIYYTRDKLNKFDKSLSSKCLRCTIIEDSLMHAFWHCKDINDSWKSIERWLSKHTNSNITFSESLCIFQDIENIKYPTNLQIIFSQLVFKKLILQNWKKREAPSLYDWKALMKFYLNIERSMSLDQNKSKQFDIQWHSIFVAL